jgi:hypothetical protein
MNDQPETRPRDPASRRVEQAKRRANRWMKWVAILGLVLAVGVVYTLAFRTLTKSDTCHALSKNDQIFKKLLEHSEKKSIENVRAGITNGTTTIHEIKHFYEPTLKELENIHCG